MSINVHYCGKIVEFSSPKQRIHEDYIYTKKERTFVYTGKQEIKITDAIFFALENPLNTMYFITLTYQWKHYINYGLAFRKKANTHCFKQKSLPRLGGSAAGGVRQSKQSKYVIGMVNVLFQFQQ